MRYYGLAISVEPDKNDPNINYVACTSTYVISEDRKNFKTYPIGKFTFDDKIDFRDPETVFNCFDRITKILEKLVSLQEEVNRQNPHPCKVALEAGRNTHNPVNIEALYICLFGKRLDANLPSEDDIILEACNTILPDLPQTLVGTKTYFQTLSEVPAELRNMPDVRKYIEHTKANQVIASQAEAALQKSSTAFYPPQYTYACAKFSGLINKCALNWGSYSNLSPAIEPEETEVSIWDLMLGGLEKPYKRGEPAAIRAVHDFAESMGKEVGATSSYRSFWIQPKTKGVEKSKELQSKFPTQVFMCWGEEAGEIYRNAHNAAMPESERRFNRRLRLPLDPPSRPFTHPCADLIRDQIQVAEGSRKPQDTNDNVAWCQKLARDAAAISNGR